MGSLAEQFQFAIPPPEHIGTGDPGEYAAHRFHREEEQAGIGEGDGACLQFTGTIPFGFAGIASENEPDPPFGLLVIPGQVGASGANRPLQGRAFDLGKAGVLFPLDRQIDQSHLAAASGVDGGDGIKQEGFYFGEHVDQPLSFWVVRTPHTAQPYPS